LLISFYSIIFIAIFYLYGYISLVKMSKTAMNISSQNIAGSCSFKCALSFSYPETTSVTASNQETQISVNVPATTIYPATFNNEKYKLHGISIFSPSLHLYNGTKADGEILILHISDTGKRLLIFIPLTTGGVSSPGTEIVTNIINAVSAGANTSGHSTNQIPNFTCNDIVPMSPFYNYEFHDFAHVIAFSEQHGITVGESDITTLQKIIKPANNSQIQSGPALFFNKEGPSTNTGNGSDIYIDCQPTGSSEEEENITSLKPIKMGSSFGVTSDQILNNPVFLFLMATLIFFVILILVHKMLLFVGTGEMPNMSLPKLGKTS